ncbi:MAG: CapA family protein [Acidobacteriota bacterium]
MRRLLCFSLALFSLCGFGPSGHAAPLEEPEANRPTLAGSPSDDLPLSEIGARETFLRTPVILRGVVLDHRGRPLSAATATVSDRSVQTGFDGFFEIEDLPRANALVRVEAAGYRSERVAAHLFRGTDVEVVDIGVVVLQPSLDETTRFLFGGDTAFGRRFLDSTDSTPRDQLPADDPDALIQVSDPEPGTRQALGFVEPLLQAADFTVVNLETPVTDDPSTPHPTKAFAFFTLSGSVPALRKAGIDYVSLGNNHVYDYLEEGLVDTLDVLAREGLPASGAGLTPFEAFEPFVTRRGGHAYSFLSMTSIAGRQHELTYVAETTPSGTKGGAADLTDSDAVRTEVIAATVRGEIPIAQLHQGFEYVAEAAASNLARVDDVVSRGAGLVVAHHPHVIQGFGWHGDVLAAYGLGNFAFDQARLETMLGHLLRVDLEGRRVHAASSIPVYLEDFRPRPIGGRLASAVGRRVAELSAPTGARVLPARGHGEILLPSDSFSTIERRLDVPLLGDAPNWRVADLRARLREGEYVVGGHAPGARVRPGRDLMTFGDVEDYDVDGIELEAARWDVEGDSRFACLAGAHDTAALCSTRSGSNRTASTTTFRNRVRVEGDARNEPIKEVSLFARLRGSGAGPWRLETEYRASVGDRSFGGETPVSDSGGSFPWRVVTADLALPPDDADTLDPTRDEARAIRLRMVHEPPATGDGLLQADDFALVSWGDGVAGDRFELASPSAIDFLRFEGAFPDRAEVRLQSRHRAFACVPDATTLCLRDRFRLQVEWTDFQGSTGQGRAVPLTTDTGGFWFFDSANLEVVVKSLDGTGVNGHDWVFFGSLSDVAFTLSVTDLWTGRMRRYRNEAHELSSVGDARAFEGTVVEAPLGLSTSARLQDDSRERDSSSATPTLELDAGRFALEVRWRDFEGRSGVATARQLTNDTGYFWFFDEDNVEVVAKVLDGRSINGHFWVFFASLSNVEFTLVVVDLVTGRTQTYRNPLGTFASQSDVLALPADPPTP